MSLRGRLLAASLALVAVGLSGAGVFTYFAFRSFLIHRLDSQLAGASSGVVHSFRLGGLDPRAINQVPTTIKGIIVQIVRGDGTEIASTPNASLLPDNLPIPSTVGIGHPFATGSTAGGDDRLEVQVSNLGGAWVAVALPLTEVRNTLAGLILVEVLVGAAVLAATAALGAYLVRLGLRPLEEIEDTAARIAAGDLTERVARSEEHTELGRLGRALNAMLGHIEAAFEERRASEEALRASEERLRRFVSDASHELRTPVASVRAYAELFRRGADRHPEDLARLMTRIESEAARMGILVEDLLLLTRLDQGRPLEQAPVDLGAVAADAVDAARTIEPDRPIALDVQGLVEVLGDRDRLRQVTDNLLTNVRVHTPATSPAAVTVRLEGSRALIEVADTGPGLDPDDAQRLFERFYRADPSRSRDNGGSGLGLSIVAAIAAAHGGAARAANRPDGSGAIFTIELPALEAATQPPAPPAAPVTEPEPVPEAATQPPAAGAPLTEPEPVPEVDEPTPDALPNQAPAPVGLR